MFKDFVEDGVVFFWGCGGRGEMVWLSIVWFGIDVDGLSDNVIFWFWYRYWLSVLCFWDVVSLFVLVVYIWIFVCVDFFVKVIKFIIVVVGWGRFLRWRGWWGILWWFVWVGRGGRVDMEMGRVVKGVSICYDRLVVRLEVFLGGVCGI